MSADDKYLFSHDQNFKNLIVDYPIEAIEFFARDAFPKIEGNPNITFLRQEQSKHKLDDSHTELDVPILLEWPDTQEKAAVVFTIEPESNPYSFDVIRLARYCLGLAKDHNTERVIPVVVFLKPGKFKQGLTLGTKVMRSLRFRFLHCHLAQLDYRHWRNSDNILARITLPLMRYDEAEKLTVANYAMRALYTDPDTARQQKYTPFITHYANFTEQDIINYKQRYPQEGEAMTSYTQQLFERGIQQAMQEGVQQGMEQGVQQGLAQGQEQGERQLLLRQLKRRFGAQSVRTYEAKLLRASTSDIERWAENILDAKTIEEVFM
ncbi:MAG TPA: DUF4351 domain-containing protein [Alcanivoracaceae bacterium]|nr:DUF4351 domain-containing protein [Alcanivoracaceae bacterium]